MARKTSKEDAPSVAPIEVSETDKDRARQWFKKAEDCRERREYDYAIECYITGLGYWPDAVEDGHMPLRAVAVQRQQVGGKKPGMMDGLKRPMTGKDPVKCMLNAEHLLSLDPPNGSYAEGVLKNAAKAGLLPVVKWAAPIVFDSLKRDKKPNKARFKAFRDVLVEAAELADERHDNASVTWLLDQAVNSLEYLIVRNPTDEDLKNEQRDMAGRLTISRGKYDDAEDFRDSLQDAEKQKLLHDGDRVKQTEQAVESLIAAARKEWEAAPEVLVKLNAYVDALLRTESAAHERKAIEVLTREWERTENYSLKLRADDVRLRQQNRAVRALIARAKETRSEEDQQQARLAAMDLRQQSIEIYRERVAKYPTDLRMKYKLGAALFEDGAYDEAIPLLQAAQADPKTRSRCRLLIGRAFYETDNAAQAVEVLRETLAAQEIMDDFSKELLYWLGRAAEAAGAVEDAKAAYGKLLRVDYNFRDGDARRRLDNLKT